MASGAFGAGTQAVGSISGFPAKAALTSPLVSFAGRGFLIWAFIVVTRVGIVLILTHRLPRYIAGKMHLFDRNGHTFKSFIFISPLTGAMLVAISRTMDYRRASLLRLHS